MAKEPPLRTGTRFWAQIGVINLSSFIMGMTLVQLNTVTGDPTAPGALIAADSGLIVGAQAALYAAAIASSLGARAPLEWFGRRATLLAGDLLILGGAALTALPSSPSVPLVVGRVLIGAACGLVLAGVPTLIAEVSPPRVRGAAGFTFTVGMNLGALCCNGLALALTQRPEGWRLANGALALPAFAQLVATRVLPESARWRERRAAARVATPPDTPRDASAAAGAAPSSAEGAELWSPAALRAWLIELRRPLAIGGALAALQALCGAQVINSYSTQLLRAAGVARAGQGTIVASAAAAFATLGSALLADRLGRRALLAASAAAMAGAGLTIGVSPLLAPPRGDGGARGGGGDAIAVGALAVFTGGFGIGLGTSPHTAAPLPVSLPLGDEVC